MSDMLNDDDEQGGGKERERLHSLLKDTYMYGI